MSVVVLSPEHSLKTLEWLDSAYKFGQLTEDFVIFMLLYFPTKNLFIKNIKCIKRYAITALADEEQEILTLTDEMLRKKNKSP